MTLARQAAAAASAVRMRTKISGGGSDANIFFEQGDSVSAFWAPACARSTPRGSTCAWTTWSGPRSCCSKLFSCMRALAMGYEGGPV
ncbi:MAG: hypothetical protein MZV70_76000 [Desulfobacterales bacterium]|nr:hypothetical protein [Desulfobacterales bacterium]